MEKINAKALKEELLSGNFTTTYYDRLIADVVSTIGESILDKIRAEIERMNYLDIEDGSDGYDKYVDQYDVLQIINKYKIESREKINEICDLSAIAKAIRNGKQFPHGIITTDKAIRIIRKYLGYSDGYPYNTVDAIIEDILYASDEEGAEE